MTTKRIRLNGKSNITTRKYSEYKAINNLWKKRPVYMQNESRNRLSLCSHQYLLLMSRKRKKTRRRTTNVLLKRKECVSKSVVCTFVNEFYHNTCNKRFYIDSRNHLTEVTTPNDTQKQKSIITSE